MTFDNCDRFVGPMPVQDFLEDFLPSPEAPASRPKGDFAFSKPSVSQNEVELIQAIRKSRLCPDLHFLNTTSRPDKTYGLKPDISVFSHTPTMDLATELPTVLDWGIVELWVENKPKGNDPFIRIEELQTSPDDVSCHVGWTVGAYKTCGQLIAYATALHRSQFRVFSFSIALFGDTGRLLRWDRSGVIYTEPFRLADGDLLEFLWRFNHLSAVDRGHDTTVSSTYPKFENLQKGHLHKILVWDDRAPDENPKCYITPSAKWATGALIGATFRYIAYDVESRNLVYLKDYWRVDHPDVQKEGDVYRELHEAEVPNIARMGRAGDVPQILGRGELQVPWLGVQRTKTQDYLSRPGSPCSWCPGHLCVETYIHYRLVLETVGMSLNRFRSTRQLCEVIRDAIVAHTTAYNKTRILHRDISAGNILITDKGTGILADWDLSEKVKEVGDSKPRPHSRTGTWQFISIGRLMDPWSRPHEVSDDLESFFWVLLYEVVRYRNDGPMRLGETMQAVFGQHTRADRAGHVRGGEGKLCCVVGLKYSSAVIETLVKTPCCGIIEEMRSLFCDLYLHMEAGDVSPYVRSMIEEERERDPRVNRAREMLRTSDVFLGIIEKFLKSEWDINNDSGMRLTEPRVDPSASRNRRKRKAEDHDGRELNIHLKRQSRDGLSSQTSSCRNNIFSISSRMHSSSVDLSSSLRSGNGGSSAKQQY
ncbi:hypothetical protein BJV78DRAFT_1246563, partial [Lactifluus subvellereus]